MEWLPLFILFCGDFAERLFGFPLKRKLFEGRSKLAPDIVQGSSPVVYCGGILLSIAGITLHQHYFYSVPLDSHVIFLMFTGIFLFFLNSSLYRQFSRSVFQKSMKGEPEENILQEKSRLHCYIASPLPIEAEGCHAPVIFTTAAFLLETVVAPIFLLFVGGYLLFALYFLLYLLLVAFRAKSLFLLELYRGFLFLPGIFSLVVFAFTAFAAGKSFGKVSLVSLKNARKCLDGHEGLQLLNVISLVAILEVTLKFQLKGKELVLAHGEERLNQRTYILIQRLLGIQKFMTIVFSYYLYVVL